MPFEYDPRKSTHNLEKHGIDFEIAQALWDDTRLVVAPAKVIDEVRYVAIGKIDQKHWTAVFTFRGPVVRIISVRRSRRMEIEYYEGI